MRSIGRNIVLLILPTLLGSAAAAQNAFPPKDQEMVKAFERRANEYAVQRSRIEARIPKLSKTASIEEIAAHKFALQDAIQKNVL